jgi:light-regulated signal transduction histidine kinase (bacteriophytochrome)
LFFFTVAVILSAAYGSIGPGLLATALSIGILLSLFPHEIFVLALARSSLTLSLMLFAVIGVAVSIVTGTLHKTNATLVRAKHQLEIANEKLSERTEVLSQANEQLRHFAYALAHDLNTPLRGISALTDLLVQRNAEKLDENSKECAGLIVDKVQRMQSMIKGLLDYAAAVEKPDGRAPTDCNAVVKRAIQDLDSVIETSGAQVTFDPLPAVRATESHLVQVFSNLISNAIKYRPSARKPQIRISAREDGANWCFCVSDNGIGLDMKYADEIFGMFKRLHGSGEYEGSGIGLSLCKMVIQRHGGRIWVESELGKGSNFFFTLPKGIEERSENPRKPIVKERAPDRAKRAAGNQQ